MSKKHLNYETHFDHFLFLRVRNGRVIMTLKWKYKVISVINANQSLKWHLNIVPHAEKVKQQFLKGFIGQQFGRHFKL